MSGHDPVIDYLSFSKTRHFHSLCSHVNWSLMNIESFCMFDLRSFRCKSSFQKPSSAFNPTSKENAKYFDAKAFPSYKPNFLKALISQKLCKALQSGFNVSCNKAFKLICNISAHRWKFKLDKFKQLHYLFLRHKLKEICK